MRPNWPKIASMARKLVHSTTFSYLVVFLLPKDNPFIEHINTFNGMNRKWYYLLLSSMPWKRPVCSHRSTRI